MSWDPGQYLKFGGERLRPAFDLLARVPIESPREIVDLGCGTGTVTALVQKRWPDAHIVGVDNSDAMLAKARASLASIEWQNADLAQWSPKAPVDLIVSNAALHWLDDHETLFPRLIRHLSDGGALAMQMPVQHDAPSHQLGYDLAESTRWRGKLGKLVRRRPVLAPDAYYAILRPHASSLDLWSTEYVQALSGENPVAEFTKGSFIGVFLSALAPEEARDFEAEYRSAVRAAYPPREDGVTLFAFRRFFLVARR
jgi:trans-aconitate 2-methyltransferase